MSDEAVAEHKMLDRPRRQSLKGWMRRNRSPLARKIIIYNVFGLLVLVFGILYLNQNDNSIIEQSQTMLQTEARVISAALRGTPPQDIVERFRYLADPANSSAVLYGADGRVLSFLAEQPDSISTQGLVESSSPMMRGLQSLWSTVAGFGLDPAGDVQSSPLAGYVDLAQRAVASGTVQMETVIDTDGQMFVAVSSPVEGPYAIVLATHRGEIDSKIRAARERILEMFVLAILCSIILSVLLANSIARPLRQLVNATDVGSGRINPARIRIPDMTARPDEVGELSRALRSMTDALYQRIEENKIFAADVAHELKNPLTSMRSAVETLDYVKTDADRNELLNIIRVDVDRMNRLVTDISNTSRLEAELVRETWRPVAMDVLLSDLVRHHDLQADAAGVRIIMRQQGRDMAVRGLESRLAQVFANIIGNALSFVPAGGEIAIVINALGEDSVQVDITDTGPGIPPDNLDDIFKRFYSSRPDTEFGDHSGLGLAISRQIIAAHGGTITAGNRTDGQSGAVFTVVLPR